MELTPEQEDQYFKQAMNKGKVLAEDLKPAHTEISEQQITAIVDLCAAKGKLISREQAKEFIEATNKQMEAEKNMSFKERMKKLQNKRK
jgi:polyhydroxyalkanoate synthesis regulator phasin